jgi:hypothetical protein
MTEVTEINSTTYSLDGDVDIETSITTLTVQPDTTESSTDTKTEETLQSVAKALIEKKPTTTVAKAPIKKPTTTETTGQAKGKNETKDDTAPEGYVAIQLLLIDRCMDVFWKNVAELLKVINTVLTLEKKVQTQVAKVGNMGGYSN